MRDSRRDFVILLLGAGGTLTLRPQSLIAQSPKLKPPMPAENTVPLPAPHRTTHADLVANATNIRNGVHRLYDLVNALKIEIDRTDPTEIFSVTLFKRAEEIEKLAKRIKNLARVSS